MERLFELLQGYSDPSGYVHPKDGKRFDNLDLAGRFPIIEKARRVPELLRYPNGRVVAFHDTWARQAGEPTEVSEPLLMPAVGHARLGRGHGTHQVQVHLHFSGGYGHQHADLLSMTLFAHGKERLSDIGYSHTRYRCWTLSHNTVVVDGRDQEFGSEKPTVRRKSTAVRAWRRGLSSCGGERGSSLSRHHPDMILQGRIGFVRERGGKVERMTLVGGTVMGKGTHRLRGGERVSGRILAVLRKARGDAIDGFVMDRQIPASQRLVGRSAIVMDGAGFTYGYEVAGVEDQKDHTILVLTCDPGFEMHPDGTNRHCFFPGRSWRGENRCEIANVTTRILA